MSSDRVPAPKSQFPILHLILAIFLILTPQALWAQGGSEDTGGNDDPPPFTYPPPDPTGKGSPHGTRILEAFFCRVAADGLSCAGEIGLGDRFTFTLASGPDIFTFFLDAHETVVLKTRGNVDTFGELFDAAGLRLARDDDSGTGGNFRITATLHPGRYFLAVTGTAGAEGFSTLQTVRKRPSPGRVTAISAFETVDGAFERPGDVDVYAVDLRRAGRLMIDVDGAVEYELKGADGKTSLGLASSSLGATLAPLPQGSYYLYVSPRGQEAERYRLRLELR